MLSYKKKKAWNTSRMLKWNLFILLFSKNFIVIVKSFFMTSFPLQQRIAAGFFLLLLFHIILMVKQGDVSVHV